MPNLVNITIDNKKIQAPEGANLLQVAKDNGITIPHLCYHKKLTPTGACRLCLVKIKDMRGMVTSCTIKVEEGMEVTAFDAELEDAAAQARRGVLFGLTGALSVMLMKAINKPINKPVMEAASSPSQTEPVFIPIKNPEYAPISMIPSTPRLSTPDACAKVSPREAYR